MTTPLRGRGRTLRAIYFTQTTQVTAITEARIKSSDNEYNQEGGSNGSYDCRHCAGVDVFWLTARHAAHFKPPTSLGLALQF